MKHVDFSLFYFAAMQPQPAEDAYRLYLEGAQAADRLGFKAVWTPERHFTDMAAAYPNPSVLSAAIAMTTEHIQLRAGSVVAPLHQPLRIAEEWSMVDNLSKGRAGISFASGWVPNDFVFAPTAYGDRFAATLKTISQVRRLWRGEAITMMNGVGVNTDVRILPRPVQPELPIWLTASRSPETFTAAGREGVNVLTALLYQTVDELAEKIRLYRGARHESGLDPNEGIVTLMLHTFVCKDEAEAIETARSALATYFRSHTALRQSVATDLAMAPTAEQDDFEKLIELSVWRFVKTASLIGSPSSCSKIVRRLREIGVDEIACLIDFGVPTDLALQNLVHLKRLADRHQLSANNDLENVDLS